MTRPTQVTTNSQLAGAQFSLAIVEQWHLPRAATRPNLIPAELAFCVELSLLGQANTSRTKSAVPLLSSDAAGDHGILLEPQPDQRTDIEMTE